MTKTEYSDRVCKDCDTDLYIYNPAQVYGCEHCEDAWTMEELDDWANDDTMPPTETSYSDYFQT